MNMKHLILISSLLSVIGIFSSCKKNNPTYTIAGNYAPAVSVPADGFGVFYETKVITSEDYNLPINTGGCMGRSETKMYTISNINNQQMSIGTVGFDLAMDSLNIGYVSYGGKNIPVGGGGCALFYQLSNAGPSDTIVFSNFTSWAGSLYAVSSSYPFNNIDSVSYSFTDNLAFPTIGDITTSGTVSTQSGYTLSSYGATSGDSVIFLITGPKATIRATLGPNATSCTFTAAQMASLGTTGGNKYGLLQIVPFSFAPQIVNGNKYYILKETCLSKYVVLD